jgi:hypothetical protein
MTNHVLIETDGLVLRTVTMEDVEQVADSWRLDAGPLSRTEAEEQVTWMPDNHRQMRRGE